MEIAVKHLCKSFGGRTVLRDLTFTAASDMVVTSLW